MNKAQLAAVSQIQIYASFLIHTRRISVTLQIVQIKIANWKYA